MAVKKKPEERKLEILDAAEKIFVQKGYEETSVEDILRSVQMSKGGFYHHFASKEEVLDSIIKRYIDQMMEAAKMVVSNTELNAKQKLLQMLGAMQISGHDSDEILTQLHHPQNRTMHLKSLLESAKALTPYFGAIARQGIEDGLFHMDYPEEIMEALFMTATIWFDEIFFDFTPEEKRKRGAAFLEIAEKCSGVERGTFREMEEMM